MTCHYIASACLLLAALALALFIHFVISHGIKQSYFMSIQICGTQAENGLDHETCIISHIHIQGSNDPWLYCLNQAISTHRISQKNHSRLFRLAFLPKTSSWDFDQEDMAGGRFHILVLRWLLQAKLILLNICSPNHVALCMLTSGYYSDGSMCCRVNNKMFIVVKLSTLK